KRLEPLYDEKLLPKGFKFWVCGSALYDNSSRDVDLFTPSRWPDDVGASEKIVFQTRNATTIKVGDTLYQFCNYSKDDLPSLLESFDYAHTQIGCDVEVGDKHFRVYDVYWTREYETSLVAGTSWFLGSEYPLSSLLRAG